MQPARMRGKGFCFLGALMIREERRTWKPSEGKRRPTKPNVVVLKGKQTATPPFYLSDKILGKTTRKENVQSWDAFFVELRKAWKLKVDLKAWRTAGRGNTIEKRQREKLSKIINWLDWLHGNEPFSRGRARAIEELMQNFSWFVVLEGEKFRDKFRWMEERLKQVSRMRWDATEFLRRKYPDKVFNPIELGKLDASPCKEEARKFLRKHSSYRGLVNLNDYIKEVFRKE